MTYIYTNEDEIDIELKCSICNEPFQSPMNCKSCGNTYCQECIMQWMVQQLSCPSCRQIGNQFLPVISRVVLNQLNRLLVQCTLCQQMNIQRNRWDAWNLINGQYDAISYYSHRAMSPEHFHYRLPFFAKVNSDINITINGDMQDMLVLIIVHLDQIV
ncbi:unnamed protein product [Adineta steineri]|uniref:RING-type domain-containing protein n=1 Tax=Adineta steineri TaxID=433720 RepID=A0A819V3K5_9BILA|nr:unnamed protein product [Adineta steineri]CAF4102424.1 unnamed protein product [Adineta steineri]